MRDGLLTERIKDPTDWSCIGPGPDVLDHRFGVIAASLTEYAQASASATAVQSSCGTSWPSARPASASASSGSLCTGTPASRARSRIVAATAPRPAATTRGAPVPVYLSAALTSRSGIEVQRLPPRRDLHRGLEAGPGVQAVLQAARGRVREGEGAA